MSEDSNEYLNGIVSCIPIKVNSEELIEGIMVIIPETID